MSESATPDSQPPSRLYQFGDWEQPDAEPEQVTDLGKRIMAWFAGEPGEVDDKLSRALHVEFSCHERFRTALMNEVGRLANGLKELAAASVSDLDVPFRRPEEFDSGYRAGTYRAYSESAQHVCNALNTIVAKLALESEQLRRERMAKLEAEG